MVITVPVQKRSGNGPRPINLNKGIPQVMELLRVAFGKSLDAEGRRWLNGYTSLHQPAFLWRLNPGASRLSTGYVWEADGRIVGNVTLLNTEVDKRYLVVNVAVHPDYRRQGIARTLMETVLDLVQARQGRQVVLQVVKDNTAAINLYESMHFSTVGHMSNWYAYPSRLRTIPGAAHGRPGPYIRELYRHEWRAAYELDRICLHPDLNWPDPLLPDAYKSGLWRRLLDFFNGRRSETWVTTGNHNRLTGLVSILSEWGRAHQLSIRVHPAWRGQLERPLLAKALRRLRYLPRRNLRLNHSDDDPVMNQLLREANFRLRRTLTHMRLDLGAGR
jgi:ribosomal protein S18 acetylase RimI-like enzyme